MARRTLSRLANTIARSREAGAPELVLKCPERSLKLRQRAEPQLATGESKVSLGKHIYAATFVRRCVTGSAMAPIPHPPGGRRQSSAFAPGHRRRSPAPVPTERSVQICRVAQLLLAFAPTEPTVRRYRSGLFRKDLRRIDHLCQACWMTVQGVGRRSGRERLSRITPL
jgi:hypothetical protein